LQKTEQFIQEIREGLWDENQLRELFVEPVDWKKLQDLHNFEWLSFSGWFNKQSDT
jgi:hypothetical protein